MNIHEFSLKLTLVRSRKRLKSFLFSVIIMGNSAFHFLEMMMLMSKVGMLNQTRIGVCSITFQSRGMRGHHMSSLCQNPEICTYFWVTQPLIFLK